MADIAACSARWSALLADMRKRLALSVGINDYPQEPLPYPVADATRCSDELAKTAFPCLVRANADCSKFEQYLGIFCEQITEVHDFILFNFNGHCEVLDGEAVLIFKDGEEQAGGRMPVQTVIEKIAHSKCSHDAVILCLMNSCRGMAKECADKLKKPRSRSAWGRALVTMWASPFGCPAEDVQSSAGCSKA